MNSILRISDAASIAFHTMYILASNNDKLFSTKEIALTLNVSENHLAKVLQRLAKVGLVSSARGPKGGFVLGKKPQEITLLDIYEVIDGPLNPATCLIGKPVCNNNCILGDLIESINKKVTEQFKSTKLSQFVQ